MAGRSGHITSTGEVGVDGTVGASDVDKIRSTVARFEELDHNYGGGHARKAAVRYLAGTVSPLLQGSYTGSVGSALFATAAEFTYKTGAMAYDIGWHGHARRYFVQALGMAQASGDRALGGKVLALMSHQATHLGEFTEAADLARAAALGGAGHATPRARAMYAAMEARALAGQGDKSECRRVLADAERAFQHVDTVDEPHWIASVHRPGAKTTFRWRRRPAGSATCSDSPSAPQCATQPALGQTNT